MNIWLFSASRLVVILLESLVRTGEECYGDRVTDRRASVNPRFSFFIYTDIDSVGETFQHVIGECRM